MKQNDHIFSVGNRLRGVKSGKVYRVIEADLPLCFAFLRDETGQAHIVDWLSPAGVVNDDIFSRYELVEG